MYGIEEFSAIINPPQAGIIAIGDILEDVMLLMVNLKFVRSCLMFYQLTIE